MIENGHCCRYRFFVANDKLHVLYEVTVIRTVPLIGSSMAVGSRDNDTQLQGWYFVP